MRKEIVAEIKKKLETELSIPILTYLPVFSSDPKAIKTPHAIVQIGTEEASPEIRNKGYRIIPVTVMIVNKAMTNMQIEAAQDEIYDLVDTTDEKLHQWKFTVGTKSPHLLFQTVEWVKDLDEKGSAIILAAEVNFNCITTR